MTMPTHEPQDAHARFAVAYNAGDLEGLLALYEPDAATVLEPERVVASTAAIREALEEFLALWGTIALATGTVVRAGELALLHGSWTLQGTGADGSPVSLGDRTSEVARRQADGSWRYVIGDPYSAD
jgi:ketosteroid isomerase-like protein